MIPVAFQTNEVVVRLKWRGKGGLPRKPVEHKHDHEQPATIYQDVPRPFSHPLVLKRSRVLFCSTPALPGAGFSFLLGGGEQTALLSKGGIFNAHRACAEPGTPPPWHWLAEPWETYGGGQCPLPLPLPLPLTHLQLANTLQQQLKKLQGLSVVLKSISSHHSLETPNSCINPACYAHVQLPGMDIHHFMRIGQYTHFLFPKHMIENIDYWWCMFTHTIHAK